MGLWKQLFGDESTRFLKEVRTLVARINDLEEETKKLADADFPKKTEEFKERLEKGESLDDLLPQAYAVVREAAWRTLGQRHYDVQLIGGIALHQGRIAEMRTGEGKTLVATLPVYLNALTGKGVHVVTVNDYLAKRDAQWMGQVYDFLGLTTAVLNGNNTSYKYDKEHVQEQGEDEAAVDQERDELGSFKVFEEYLPECSRKEAYEADITYGTNNEFGFDYLRDNTQQSVYGLVQRGETPHNYVIVDEIDSVLIDEARVPLILSTPGEDATDRYTTLARVAGQLVEGDDYEKDEKLRAITLTDPGIAKAEKLLGVENIYTAEGIGLVHHLETAVKAKAVYERDKEYVVKDGKVMIVDPFTGRIQESRRWSDGLHQAIEAKEGVQIQQESKTMASITYQNYFKFYSKLSGMTGTARTSAEEFHKVYDLDVIEIPTNKPIARIDNVDLIYQTEEGKFKAIARKVKELQEKGQPVLIGTVSVEKSELLSAYLNQEGVQHEVLNAKKHQEEGQVVAQAGRKGSVTVATNMAGRGVDIKLGGNPTTDELEKEIKDIGGLFVLGTERHEARRIDNQLRGRAGRQGDPGETQFFVSLEDSLMRVFGSDRVKGMIGALGIEEDQAIQNKMISRGLENAQEKIEGFNFDARKHVLQYDDVLSRHRNLVYERRRNMLFDNQEFIDELFDEVLEAAGEKRALIEKRKQEFGDEKFAEIFKRVALFTIDNLWMQHLEVMENVRQSVNLRAYGQREPLVEYKKESLRLFREMEGTLRQRIADVLEHIDQKSEEQRQASLTRAASDAAVPKGLGRNDKITVQKDGETKEIKAKKLEGALAEGWTIKV